MEFNFAQTFYLDPSAVSNSSILFLTGIDLFFKTLPTSINNASGIINPGVSLFVATVDSDGIPNPAGIVQGSRVRLGWDDITSSDNSETLTTFHFKQPIPFKTGETYCIVVKFEDPGFVIWTSNQGDRLVGTNTPFSGPAGKYVGQYFEYNNGGTWKASSALDLVFRINAARFTANAATFELVHSNFEFFTINTANGVFSGGELVYTSSNSYMSGSIAFATSNNTITGNGTTFTTDLQVNNYVVLVGSNNIVRQISNVVSDTVALVYENIPYTNSVAHMYKSAVAEVYTYNQLNGSLILNKSSANSSLKYTAGTTINGEDSGASANLASINVLNVHQFNANLHVGITPNSTMNLYFDVAASNGSVDAVDDLIQAKFTLSSNNYLNKANNVIESRSLEVANANNLHDGKSTFIQTVFQTNEDPGDGLYDAPYIYNRKLDVIFGTNKINNDSVDENTRYGNALAKHLTSKISFAAGMVAEDIVVYADLYQPPGTKVLCYAKIFNSHDSDAFDDKDWTPLDIKLGDNLTSSESNLDDFVEVIYGFPPYPASNTTLAGTVVTSNNSATITGIGTTFTSLATNQLIKISQPLFPTDYMITSVGTVANATSMTINDLVINTDVIGSGLVIDVLKYNHTAFNNGLNDNVVRYYNSNMNAFDGYDTMALKFVMLSTNPRLIPHIKEIRSIGVSA
jgi:hypothetical protein